MREPLEIHSHCVEEDGAWSIHMKVAGIPYKHDAATLRSRLEKFIIYNVDPEQIANVEVVEHGRD